MSVRRYPRRLLPTLSDGEVESLLALTPYQSARDTRADGLASANFEKSLNQLNRLDEKAFQQFFQRKMKKWLQDFPQMVPAEDAEGIEVVDLIFMNSLMNSYR